MKHPSLINTIWIITREYGALAGAGGVKDVARQLAAALARSGRQVSVALPLYGFMDPERQGFTRLDLSFDLDMSYTLEERREEVTVWHRLETVQSPRVSDGDSVHSPPRSNGGGVDLYLIDSPRFREKNGVYTYTAADERHNLLHRQGEGHGDYFAMNVLLQKAALCLMIRLDQRPDVIHCHDGHTALLPAMVRELDGFRHYFRDTGLVVTIHNAGLGYHQEVHDLPFARAITGLPERVINDNLLAGAFDPFLAASSYAVLNTVSENYARELRETEDDLLTGWLGHALQDRGLALQGVTNGIEPDDFDPRNPRALKLAAGFQPGEEWGGGHERSGKELCKEALCAAIAERRLSNPKVLQNGEIAFQPDQPLFTFIGRLSTQKGVDKMIEALLYLLPIDRNFQVLIMGNGPKEIEDPLIAMTHDSRHHGRVCLLRGFDHDLANQVYAAGDFFLIPSRYEPCGLTDFIAQLFGNLPIVHHVGGLVKVVDGETGFAFHQHSGLALAEAMQRALGTFRSSRPTIIAMQRAAARLIHERYSWDQVKERYLELYATSRDTR